MSEHEGDPVEIVFRRDVDRERGIISQSNARSASISQLLSAVWAATGIVAVFILSKPSVEMTRISVFFGCIAIASFAVQLLAKAAILWPRGLNNLPHDENEAAYRERLEAAATAVRENPDLPTDMEYHEGFLLQRIRAAKERCTQVTLVAIAAYLVFIILFFATLKY